MRLLVGISFSIFNRTFYFSFFGLKSIFLSLLPSSSSSSPSPFSFLFFSSQIPYLFLPLLYTERDTIRKYNPPSTFPLCELSSIIMDSHRSLMSSTSTLCLLLCIYASFVVVSNGELQRFIEPAKSDGSVSFIVIGDWGRRGSFNQSIVAYQVLVSKIIIIWNILIIYCSFCPRTMTY